MTVNHRNMPLFGKKAKQVALAVAAMLLFSSARNVPALPLPSLTLPELVQQADVICIGTPLSIEERGTAMVDTGLFEAEGKPLLQSAQLRQATFSVERTIKGEVAPTLHITFPQTAFVAGPNQVPFTVLEVGERILVFLHSDADPNTATLFSPSNVPPPQIPLGSAKLSDSKAASTPLRRVLLQLAQTLAVQNKAIQLDCLSRIQSSGFLLYAEVGMSASQNTKNIRLGLGESDSSHLEEFVAENVLPAVVALTTSADADVKMSALITAAKLQDVAVIPQLVELIKDNQGDKQGNASRAAKDALRYFRAPSALKPLIFLSEDEDVNLRQSATFALFEIADPLSVPALVKRLDDPDSQVRQSAVFGLYLITKKPGPARHADGSPPTKQEHLAFWKEWAANHPDKLDSLRQQLDAQPVVAPLAN